MAGSENKCVYIHYLFGILFLAPIDQIVLLGQQICQQENSVKIPRGRDNHVYIFLYVVSSLMLLYYRTS